MHSRGEWGNPPCGRLATEWSQGETNAKGVVTPRPPGRPEFDNRKAVVLATRWAGSGHTICERFCSAVGRIEPCRQSTSAPSIRTPVVGRSGSPVSHSCSSTQPPATRWKPGPVKMLSTPGATGDIRAEPHLCPTAAGHAQRGSFYLAFIVQQLVPEAPAAHVRRTNGLSQPNQGAFPPFRTGEARELGSW